MLTTLILMALSAAGAGGFVAWRLKGDRTWREAGAVIFGGGPVNPKPPK